MTRGIQWGYNDAGDLRQYRTIIITSLAGNPSGIWSHWLLCWLF